MDKTDKSAIGAKMSEISSNQILDKSSSIDLDPTDNTDSVKQGGSGAGAEELYKCKYSNCVRSYVQRKDLYKHIKKKHLKERELEKNDRNDDNEPKHYKCNACPETFRTLDQLKKHRIRRHTKE